MSSATPPAAPIDRGQREDDLGLERRRLHDLATDLAVELAGIVASVDDDPPDDEHDIEGSSIAFERSKVAALLASTTERITAIDRAIDRLGSGGPPTCSSCGEMIDPERLAAVAGTDRCICCAPTRPTGLRRRPTAT